MKHLTSLDVTGLSGVDEFACSGNKLTSIDLTGMTGATSIYLDGNALTSIDIAPCTSLEKIMVAENELTSIDLSKNPGLSGVYVQDNKLTAIDVTSNPNVRWTLSAGIGLKEFPIVTQPADTVTHGMGIFTLHHRLVAVLTGKILGEFAYRTVHR